MTVARDGSLTGRVINSTENMSGPVRGFTLPDGTFEFSYFYSSSYEHAVMF